MEEEEDAIDMTMIFLPLAIDEEDKKSILTL
jgi:hypothetical protein